MVEEALGADPLLGRSPAGAARILEVLAHLAAGLPGGEERDALLEVGGWIEVVLSEYGAHERELVVLRLEEQRSPKGEGLRPTRAERTWASTGR